MTLDGAKVYRPVRFHNFRALKGYIDLHEAVNRLGSTSFPKSWNRPSQYNLPFFKKNGELISYRYTNRLAIGTKLKVAGESKAYYERTANRFMSVIQKLIRAVESGDLRAFYVVQLKHKPVRLHETILWSTQGVRIFSTGHMRFELKAHAPKNYRLVFREFEFNKWLQPDVPKVGKRMALGDKLAVDLIAELEQAAIKHDVRLAWEATKKIIQKHFGAVSGALIKRKVFDKLDKSVRQARQAPRLQDRDRAALEATIEEGLKRVLTVRR